MVISWANCEQEEIEDLIGQFESYYALNRNRDILLNFVRKLEIDTTISDSDNLSSEI